jgi:hypothetical protein
MWMAVFDHIPSPHPYIPWVRARDGIWMSIRMHRFPNGLDALTAFCDVCGEQITERGYVVWDPDHPEDWLLVHQSRCDPGGKQGYPFSMPLDTELIYLANNSGVDLDDERERLDRIAEAAGW